MQTKEDLIRENEILQARLALAEKWMRREIQGAIATVRRSDVKRDTRKHFENVFEEEGLDLITKRIMERFGDVLDHAPKYTLERLIDAEIYWETLQHYPHMDALPIVIAYQKILDAWIEESLIAPWRQVVKNTGKIPQIEPNDNPLEKDIKNIILRDYSLSIGRLYQMLLMNRENHLSESMLSSIITYWKKEMPKIYKVLVSKDFFLPFSELMERELFSKKRHEKKVSFADAKMTREVVVGNFEKEGLLSLIFSI